MRIFRNEGAMLYVLPPPMAPCPPSPWSSIVRSTWQSSPFVNYHKNNNNHNNNNNNGRENVGKRISRPRKVRRSHSLQLRAGRFVTKVRRHFQYFRCFFFSSHTRTITRRQSIIYSLDTFFLSKNRLDWLKIKICKSFVLSWTLLLSTNSLLSTSYRHAMYGNVKVI